MKGILIFRLAFLLMFLSVSLPQSFAQGGTPIFHRRFMPPTAEAPVRQQIPEREPIPQGFIIAGEALVTLVSVVILVAAIRAWRESNVFGRQYLFRPAERAAQRFGGARSGGLMAVIEPGKEKKA